MSAAELLAVRHPGALADLLREANAARRGLLVTSGEDALPALPGDEGRLGLSLAPLHGIVHHDPGDEVIGVEPGVLLDDLADRVARDGQRLAIEAPRGLGFTVGGAVAAGLEGFVGARYGALREQILGLAATLPDGRVSRAGGRVVKNVTGYDLVRLHCGAAGQFGVLHEITLRLRPLPRGRRTLVFSRGDATEAFALARRLRDLDHRLSGLAVAGGAAVAAGAGPWLVALRVEGSGTSLEDAESRGAAEGPYDALEGADESELWDALTRGPWVAPFRLSVRSRPSRLGPLADDVLRAAATTGADEDEEVPGEPGLVADLFRPGFDLFGRRPAADLDAWLAASGIPARLAAAEARGSLPSEPDDRPRRAARFGAPPLARARLEDRLKRAFDPAGILGAGRWWREVSP
ncbi:MAG: FAD-binding oxidoreductase [Planctomycetota bacterium]